MQAMSIRIFLILFILVLINPSSLAATEQRIALVIGNSAYTTGPLKNPVNDATDIAATLQRLGFSVIIIKNASQRVMEESIQEFGNKLKRGGVGLFYYAGHGLQVSGVNYLIPVAANINQESDVKYEAIDANKVLDAMANANNGLNIVILDACRDNPFTRSFRDSTRGLAIVSSAPAGTFISYSTGPGNVARDGEGRNSPYAAGLIKHMTEPGQPIEQVFKSVRQTLATQSGGKQIPWELSSLQGNFYFAPGTAGKAPIIVPEGKTAAPRDDLDDENRKLEAEQQRLDEERAVLAKQKSLEEKRQKIAKQKEQLTIEQEAARQVAAERKKQKKTTTIAMAKQPSKSKTGEAGSVVRFVANNDGTVLDTRTNLMWAAKDNGDFIANWSNAESYCENYRGGGYTDWRMPTQNELAGLYDEAKTYKCKWMPSDVHLTESILLTATWVWSSETRGSEAAFFSFYDGSRHWVRQSSDASKLRALPVRSGK